MSIGERIREARKAKGLTQKELADLIGISKNTVCGYEGGYREPDVPRIHALSKALGVTGDWLIENPFADEAEQRKKERTLCEVLTHYRKTNNVSFDTLSERTEIPKSTLQKIFTGVTVDPGFEVVCRIATGLGVTVDMISAATHETPAFSPATLEIAQKYDDLDAHGQHVVTIVIDAELARIHE